MIGNLSDSVFLRIGVLRFVVCTCKCYPTNTWFWDIVLFSLFVASFQNFKFTVLWSESFGFYWMKCKILKKKTLCSWIWLDIWLVFSLLSAVSLHGMAYFLTCLAELIMWCSMCKNDIWKIGSVNQDGKEWSLCLSVLE